MLEGAWRSVLEQVASSPGRFFAWMRRYSLRARSRERPSELSTSHAGGVELGGTRSAFSTRRSCPHRRAKGGDDDDDVLPVRCVHSSGWGCPGTANLARVSNAWPLSVWQEEESAGAGVIVEERIVDRSLSMKTRLPGFRPASRRRDRWVLHAEAEDRRAEMTYCRRPNRGARGRTRCFGRWCGRGLMARRGDSE